MTDEQEREVQDWFVKLCREARLRPRKDVDGTVHIVGRRGDIYAHGPGRLAWCLFGTAATKRRKRVIKQRHVPSLLRLDQEGDEEAVFTFSPDVLVRVARLAKCSFKRKLSPEALAALREAGERSRFRSPQG